MHFPEDSEATGLLHQNCCRKFSDIKLYNYLAWSRTRLKRCFLYCSSRSSKASTAVCNAECSVTGKRLDGPIAIIHTENLIYRLNLTYRRDFRNRCADQTFVIFLCVLVDGSPWPISCIYHFNLFVSHLKTMRRLYLKTQFVPRSKHFSSRLWKPISYVVWGRSRYLFWDKFKTPKYNVGRRHNSWMLNLLVHHVTSRL